MSYDLKPDLAPRTAARPLAALAMALTMLTLAAATAGCGKEGPPTPPLREVPAPAKDLIVRQRGTHVLLSFRYPQTTPGGQALNGVSKVEVYDAELPPPKPVESKTSKDKAAKPGAAGSKGTAAAAAGAKPGTGGASAAPGGAAEGTPSATATGGQAGTTGGTGGGTAATGGAGEGTAGTTGAGTGGAETAAGASGAGAAGTAGTVGTTGTSGTTGTAGTTGTTGATGTAGATATAGAAGAAAGAAGATAPTTAGTAAGTAGTTAAKAAPGEPDQLPAPQYEKLAKVKATLAGKELGTAVLGNFIQIDIALPEPLPANPETAPTHAFAVRTFGPKGDRSGFSNQATLKPRPPPKPPEGVTVAGQADGVEIEWKAVPDASGYAVYRRAASERFSTKPLAVVKPPATRFLDQTAVFGQRYIYSVTTVDRKDPLVESALQAEMEISYVDRYPPPVPAELVAVAETARVRLVWRQSEAPDLAGYIIYRKGANGDFVRITEKPVTGTTFVDTTVTSGETYDYRVTAIDQTGNESAPSGEAHIAVP